jgi:hypothetical protein
MNLDETKIELDNLQQVVLDLYDYDKQQLMLI